MATIVLPNSPTFLGNIWKGVKIFNFLVKSFLCSFYRHLATFYWSHCPRPSRTIEASTARSSNPLSVTRRLWLFAQKRLWQTSLIFNSNQVNGIFITISKNGWMPASFLFIFVFFIWHNYIFYKSLDLLGDSNQARQDGRRRRIHCAVAAPQLSSLFKNERESDREMAN